jgi:hypothetical protein
MQDDNDDESLNEEELKMLEEQVEQFSINHKIRGKVSDYLRYLIRTGGKA